MWTWVPVHTEYSGSENIQNCILDRSEPIATKDLAQAHVNHADTPTLVSKSLQLLRLFGQYRGTFLESALSVLL